MNRIVVDYPTVLFHSPPSAISPHHQRKEALSSISSLSVQGSLSSEDYIVKTAIVKPFTQGSSEASEVAVVNVTPTCELNGRIHDDNLQYGWAGGCKWDGGQWVSARRGVDNRSDDRERFACAVKPANHRNPSDRGGKPIQFTTFNISIIVPVISSTPSCRTSPRADDIT